MNTKNIKNKNNLSDKLPDKEGVVVEIQGYYNQLIMRNYENNFVIFKLITADYQPVICSGYITVPEAEILVSVTGTTRLYGSELQLVDCKLQELATDRKSVLNLCRKIRGIGEAAASQIADNLKVPVYSLVKDKEALNKLLATGIRLGQAKALLDYIKEHEDRVRLFNILSKFRNGFAVHEKFYRAYGRRSIEVMMKNPYILMDYGLGFHHADELVSMLGIDKSGYDDTERIRSGVISAVQSHVENGDCCVEISTLEKDAKQNLSFRGDGLQSAVSAIRILTAIDSDPLKRLVLSSDDTSYKSYLYPKTIFTNESNVISAITRITKNAKKFEYDAEDLCCYAEKLCQVKYADKQREAFQAFLHGGFVVLTGGPGTGKTTVLKGLLLGYEKLYPEAKIKLCAPTGRAAQRMKEATGREASTIHRLVEYRPFGDRFECKGPHDPIDADLIVVDEASMISIDIADMLLSAVQTGAMVIWVGDTAQLPSVGPGMVLDDVIGCGKIPVYALTKTHRQGADSPIIVNANRINDGNDTLLEKEDFQVIHCKEDEINEILFRIYKKHNRAEDPFSVQILTPTRKNDTGCNAVSAFIQKNLYTQKRTGGIRFGKTTFYVGDKIMTTRNNYEVGYFNGDVGIITATSNHGITVSMVESQVTIPFDCLIDVSLAYASTIHKSQGSEYETVIISLPASAANMLQRNILYTAVTRGKKRVYLIYTEDALKTAVQTVTSKDRTTLLAHKLKRVLK